MSDLIIKVTLT